MGYGKIHRTKPCEGKTCKNVEDYSWSSAKAHVLRVRDDILSVNIECIHYHRSSTRRLVLCAQHLYPDSVRASAQSCK